MKLYWQVFGLPLQVCPSGQSVVVEQFCRQALGVPVQDCPVGHCEFAVQLPQTPLTQTWPSKHSALLAQFFWQILLLQVWPKGQSAVFVHVLRH